MRVPLGELPKFVQSVLERLLAQKKGAVLAGFSGELGSGKTTFVQALAKELGVEKTVQSPTYVLMKRYKTTHPRFKTLVHIDLYRLEREEELATLKLEEIVDDPGSLVCIEWPERARNLLPKLDLTITFSSERASAEERYIDIQT